MILLALCLRSRKINSRAGRGIEKTEVKKPSTTWLAVHNNSWHYPAAAAPPSSLYAPVFFFFFSLFYCCPTGCALRALCLHFNRLLHSFLKGNPAAATDRPPIASLFSSLSLSLSLSELILAHQLQFYFSLHPFSVCLSLSFCLRCNRGGGPLSTVSFLASTPTVTRVTSVYTSETKRSQTDTGKKRKQKRRKKKRQTETFFPVAFLLAPDHGEIIGSSRWGDGVY